MMNIRKAARRTKSNFNFRVICFRALTLSSVELRGSETRAVWIRRIQKKMVFNLQIETLTNSNLLIANANSQVRHLSIVPSPHPTNCFYIVHVAAFKRIAGDQWATDHLRKLLISEHDQTVS